MVKKLIDINADLGEGAGNDALIMPLISSCNIACGGHFGNEETMQEAVLLAKKHHVKIGAHPSFPDKDNFGRKVLTITKSELSESIFQQLLRFQAVCEMEDVPLHHIKPHGALYNYAAKDAPTADAIVDALEATKLRVKLYVPPNSILAKKAENLFPLVYEAFIDRNYNDDLSLVSRSEDNALILNKEIALQHLKRMVFEQKVLTVQGNLKNLAAETFCIHGDHLQSVEILKFLHDQFEKANIELKK